jgi:hypothetical protein
MTKRMYSIARRVVPLLGAGMLLQAGGCAVDTNALFAGLATTIARNFISSYVFGAFNLVGP